MECLKEGVPVDTPDSVGRAPLHLAAICGAIGCVRVLIANGARVGRRMVDGRNALHLAAQYGHSGVAQLLLLKGKELAEEAKKKQEKPAGAKKDTKKEKKK